MESALSRIEVLTRLVERAMDACWPLDVMLRDLPKLADMICGPLPAIDEAFARKLDQALNTDSAVAPLAATPDADKAGAAAHLRPSRMQLAAPAAPNQTKETDHAVATPGTGADEADGRAVQPRPTSTGPAPDAPTLASDELAKRIRECASEGLTSRETAERLGIKPDYCRAFASKRKISFGFGKTGPKPKQTAAERQAAIEAQRRAKTVPDPGKRGCRNCGKPFEPKRPGDTVCRPCVDRIAGPPKQPNDLSGRGGKWA
jgi:hypothetical protein